MLAILKTGRFARAYMSAYAREYESDYVTFLLGYEREKEWLSVWFTSSYA